MEELIKVTANEKGSKVVSARELYDYLEVSERFSRFMDRNLEFGFEENIDYTPYQNVHPSNNQEFLDYALTLDTAKEISMIQRSEKGKLARQYFIACEKRLQEIVPRTHLEVIDSERALLISNLEKDKVIELMKPKAEFFDQVTGSETCFDMADVAKVCNLGIGRNTLFQFLRDQKILRENNTPYQQYVDCGYFRVIESKYNKPDGSVNISLKTVVYQKGIDFIIKRFVGRNLNN